MKKKKMEWSIKSLDFIKALFLWLRRFGGPNSARGKELSIIVIFADLENSL
ncbi:MULTISPECIES: hypothetical protein [Zobellia]|uniref:hypothetical protein n=1 Tax=Zobellia TaxID=112040 RepID=UPI001C0678B2|nr:hypothetical protein [Zobellia sp. B3R18]MBU2974836.1 hypothetical protein [Zobellia sp. B3R18]